MNSYTDTNTDTQFSRVKLLIPCEVLGDSRHFDIIDQPGCKSHVFEVYVGLDHEHYKYQYELEEVNTISVDNSNDTVTRTFFIEDVDERGNRLCIITVSPDCIVVREGLLMDYSVKSSKGQCFWFTQCRKKVVSLNNCCFDLDSLTDDQIIEIGDDGSYEVDARLNSNNVIIDTVTQDVVLRTPYYDEEKHEWRAKIRFYHNRKYFAFSPMNGQEDNAERSLVGWKYATGTWGFPKDLVKAVSLWEEDASPISKFYMAEVLLNEKLIYDMQEAKRYLYLSANDGCLDAIVEYAAIQIISDTLNQELVELLEQCEVECGVRDFLRGAISEAISLSDSEMIFNYYYQAASEGFKPAQIRLSNITTGWKDEWNKSVDIRSAKEHYYHSNPGECEHCFGAMLLYGWGIDKTSRTERMQKAGLLLLRKSWELGDFNAINELYWYYLKCDQLGDNVENRYDMLSRYCLEVIKGTDDPAELNKLMNNLVDLEPQSYECDKAALLALIRAIDINPNYSTALNNLGWMYKMGRGIVEPDYLAAIDCFQKAILLGSTASYYHLGDIYEHGLGVVSSLERAKHYYKLGEGAGNQKCKDALRRIEEETERQKHIMPDKSLVLTDLTSGEGELSSLNTSDITFENFIGIFKNHYRFKMHVEVIAELCGVSRKQLVDRWIKKGSYGSMADRNYDLLFEHFEKGITDTKERCDAILEAFDLSSWYSGLTYAELQTIVIRALDSKCTSKSKIGKRYKMNKQLGIDAR